MTLAARAWSPTINDANHDGQRDGARPNQRRDDAEKIEGNGHALSLVALLTSTTPIRFSVEMKRNQQSGLLQQASSTSNSHAKTR